MVSFGVKFLMANAVMLRVIMLSVVSPLWYWHHATIIFFWGGGIFFKISIRSEETWEPRGPEQGLGDISALDTWGLYY
jgi:hypothetical protein